MNCNVFTEETGFTDLDSLNLNQKTRDLILAHRPGDHIVFTQEDGVEITIVRLATHSTVKPMEER